MKTHNKSVLKTEELLVNRAKAFPGTAEQKRLSAWGWWTWAAIGCVAASCTLALLQKHRHSVYEGKSIRAWLTDLGSPNYGVREHAREAVGHLGTNALPDIEQFLRARDTWCSQQLLTLAEVCPILRLRLFAASYYQGCGVQACWVLGAGARPMLPYLLKILHEQPSAAVAEALSGFGLEVVPALCPELAGGDDEVRIWTAFAIGRTAALAQMPAGATLDLQQIIRVLEETVRESKGRLNLVAAWALERVRCCDFRGGFCSASRRISVGNSPQLARTQTTAHSASNELSIPRPELPSVSFACRGMAMRMNEPRGGNAKLALLVVPRPTPSLIARPTIDGPSGLL